MIEKQYILFCQSPIEKGMPDEDYHNEYLSAKANGFEALLFSYEDLTDSNNMHSATSGIKPNDKPAKAIYRGWMLTPKQYAALYNDLLSKNYQLVNTPEEYQNCHYLPDSLKYIAGKTPGTIFEKLDNAGSIDKLIKKAQIFAEKPVILKDYVKSEKHDWDTACFVKNASDTNELRQTIHNLIKLRGKDLNEGIVVREFIDLKDLTIHSKSEMPLTEEYRLFFYNHKLIGTYDYWEEGVYSPAKPDTSEFEEIATKIESHFFSMDIARQKNGEFIIIELGDGQVAGLPDKANKNDFYHKLIK